MQLYQMSARRLQQGLENNEFSSVELIEALQKRTQTVDGKTNAIICSLHAQALQEAEKADQERKAGKLRGPLHGLPITIKDNIEVDGTEATLGMTSRKGLLSHQDAVVVRLLKESGAIVIGKTNIPQTLIAMETSNYIWGDTMNPWNLERVPGGSSGGEGAAIASGQTPWGIGTDIGGSVRIPAAFCGITAIKPTLHRWSTIGCLGAMPGQEFTRSQVGPLAREVDDLIWLLEVLDSSRNAQLDPEVPPLPYLQPLQDFSGLTIGVYDYDGFFQPCQSVKRAIKEASDILQGLGAKIVPYAPPRGDEHYYYLAAALSADGMKTLKKFMGSEKLIDAMKLNGNLSKAPKQALKTIARGLKAVGERRLGQTLDSLGEKSVTELWKLNAERTAMQRNELSTWNDAGIDALLCPATATPAPYLRKTADFTAAASYTTRYNLLNLPCGVVPVTRVQKNEEERLHHQDRIDKRAEQILQNSAGLPIGVQLVGKTFQEHVVLGLMKAVQEGARKGDNYPHTPVETI